MALTIKDILQLHSLKKMELISGYQGLLHYVSSAGIADYEFCSDLDYPRENAFEKGSFVLSSLLFAKENPASILPAVKQHLHIRLLFFRIYRRKSSSFPTKMIFRFFVSEPMCILKI